MVVSFAQELDGSIESDIALNRVFSTRAEGSPWNANRQYISSNTDQNSENNTFELEPGNESLTSQIKRLLTQGHVYKAVELLQNSIVHSKGSEIEGILDLAHDALLVIKDQYPYETSLLKYFSGTLDAYNQLSRELETMGWNLSEFKDLQIEIQLNIESGTGLEAVQNDINALSELLDEISILYESGIDFEISEINDEITGGVNPGSSKNTGDVTRVAAAQSNKRNAEELQRAMDRLSPSYDMDRSQYQSYAQKPSFGMFMSPN